MLHISQEERLKIIKDRINQYNIRFPVATLNKITGEDMGNISKMLKGKKSITDKFFTSFTDEYPEKQVGKEQSNNAPYMNQVLPIGDFKITVKDYIEELRVDKKKLQNTIDSNLTAMMQILTVLQRHDQAFHETILKSLGRIEGDNTDLVLEARRYEAELQVQDSLQGSNAQVGR
jgi:hypothetical protein